MELSLEAALFLAGLLIKQACGLVQGALLLHHQLAVLRARCLTRLLATKLGRRGTRRLFVVAAHDSLTDAYVGVVVRWATGTAQRWLVIRELDASFLFTCRKFLLRLDRRLLNSASANRCLSSQELLHDLHEQWLLILGSLQVGRLSKALTVPLLRGVEA